MSSTNFSSADHPRAGDGKFTEKPVVEAPGGTDALSAQRRGFTPAELAVGYRRGGDSMGTSWWRDQVQASRDKLVSVLGEPQWQSDPDDEYDEDERSTIEWVTTLADGSVFTLYDDRDGHWSNQRELRLNLGAASAESSARAMAWLRERGVFGPRGGWW